MAAVTKVAADFADHIDAVVVYIIEAHPTDGWMMENKEGINVAYAKTIEEKSILAERTRLLLCENTAMQ
jgi:hypothetical protein